MSTILLGVTGGIAAYKVADLASQLHKRGNEVHVILTEHATRFVTPLTFEAVTGQKAHDGLEGERPSRARRRM